MAIFYQTDGRTSAEGGAWLSKATLTLAVALTLTLTLTRCVALQGNPDPSPNPNPNPEPNPNQVRGSPRQLCATSARARRAPRV